MTKTQLLLLAVAVVGAFLVGQGIITGEQLTSIQNILGIAMLGGGVSVFGIIGILGAIPKQVVKSAFDKATDKYGEEAVNGFLGNVDVIINTIQTLTDKVDTIQTQLDESKVERTNLLG